MTLWLFSDRQLGARSSIAWLKSKARLRGKEERFLLCIIVNGADRGPEDAENRKHSKQNFGGQHTRTHAHTHTHSLSLSLSIYIYISLYLSISLHIYLHHTGAHSLKHPQTPIPQCLTPLRPSSGHALCAERSITLRQLPHLLEYSVEENGQQRSKSIKSTSVQAMGVSSASVLFAHVLRDNSGVLNVSMSNICSKQR